MKKIIVLVLTLTLAVTLLPTGAMAAEKKTALSGGEHMVKFAKQYVGSRYKKGGTHLKNLDKKGDKNRVDCTGFVKAIYRTYAGIKLPGGSLKRMVRKGKKLGRKIGSGTSAFSKAKPGDIVIYRPGRWRQHVAIYYGKKNGKHMVIDSSRGRGGVTIHKAQKRPNIIIRLEDNIESRSKIYKKYVKDVEKKNKTKKKKAADALPSEEILIEEQEEQPIESAAEEEDLCQEDASNCNEDATPEGSEMAEQCEMAEQDSVIAT